MNHLDVPAGGGEARLRELTAAWLEHHERGEEPDLVELCSDCPELHARTWGAGSRRWKSSMRGSMPTIRRATSDAPEETPRCIGRFRIVREVGRGGMGVVYEAGEDGLPRRLAVKVLSRRALGLPANRDRFRIEAIDSRAQTCPYRRDPRVRP